MRMRQRLRFETDNARRRQLGKAETRWMNAAGRTAFNARLWESRWGRSSFLQKNEPRP